MANKLSKEEAIKLLDKVADERVIFPNMTLGQVIFNFLTLKQISNVISDERDFFYLKDEEKVLEIFMKYCVES